jgi:hypothetical protein
MSRNGQRTIAGAGVLGGLALMALVFSIQRDPLALTSAGTAAAVSTPVTTSTPTPSPLPTSVPPPADPLASRASAGPVIELSPVRITASKSKAVPDEKRDREAAEACSEWREVGPTYVDQGEPQGTRRVRDLC